MKKLTFLITSPGYAEQCGGIVVLHKLAQLLAEFGEEVYLLTTNIDPTSTPKYTWIRSINTLPTTGDIELDEEEKETTVVIYPEIIDGNPLKAKHVVRWLLSSTNFNTPRTYDYNDSVWGLHKGYTAGTSIRPDGSPVKMDGVLHIVSIDFELFRNRHESRMPNSQCYALRKAGELDVKLIHQADALCIDQYERKGGHQFLADVFNKYETFLCYDNNTFLGVIATLCGCKTIIVPIDEKITTSQFHACPHTEGISFGFSKEEERWAENTKDLLFDVLKKSEQQSLQTVQNFITDIYSRKKN